MTALDSPHERFRRPGGRHQRQVVDHADDRRDPRGTACAPARTSRRTWARSPSGSRSTSGRCRRSASPRGAARGAGGRAGRPRARGRRPRDAVRGADRGGLLGARRGAGVDVAVVEAGLGGRYDATSVIEPAVVVLTNVGLEHTRWLGPDGAPHRRGEAGGRAGRRHARRGPARARRRSRSPSDRRASGARLSCRRTRLRGRAGRRPDFAVATPRGSLRGIVLRPLGALPAHELRARRGGGRGVPRPRWTRRRCAPRARARLARAARDRRRRPARASSTAPTIRRPRARCAPSLAERGRRAAVVARASRSSTTRTRRQCCRRCCRSATRVVFTRSSHRERCRRRRSRASARQLGGPPREVVAGPAAALDRARELAGADGAVLVTGSIYLLSDLVRGPRRSRGDRERA